MRKFILSILLLTFVLTGCADKKTSATVNEIIPKQDPVKTVYEEETDNIQSDSQDSADNENATSQLDNIPHSILHFDVLNIDLPYPEWFDDSDTTRNEFQEQGYVSFNSNDSSYFCEIYAFLLGDEIDDVTGEPVSYNQFYFDNDPSVVKDWSDANNLFKIHASSNDCDTLLSVYRGPDYIISYKMTFPSPEYDKYLPIYELACDTSSSCQPDLQVIDEQTIISECQKKYEAPSAEIDHYEYGYMPVVHCYEFIENEDESHSTTYGWIRVNPVTGDAMDEITFNTFKIPGAKLNYSK